MIEDGLQGYEFFPWSYYKSISGEMFFGGSNGFNAFYPQNVKDNPHIPPVVITTFLKYNKEVKLPKPLSEIKKLKLSYQDSFFSFQFAALDYTIPKRNKYAYKLEGLENDWIPLNHKSDITFTSLPPGDYVFRVKGSNSDGVWNEKGTSIAITISPAFWQTWWFKLFVAILLLGILAFLQRLLTNSLKQRLEKERLAKELKLKADFTAMLVHDLRSPLNVVMGYSEMLTEFPEEMDIPKTGKVITSSSEKMLTLINDMLDISKFEAGKMSLHRKNATLFEIVTNIIEIITPLLDRKGIKLVWEQETGTKKETLFIDPEKIGQVVNNLLSNAIKFTSQKGNIIIKLSRVNLDRKYHEISVTDDGPGVPAETQKFLFDKYAQLSTKVKKKGTGLGLAVSKMIIESHGGAIGYQAGPHGKGSTFYFRLPLPGLDNQNQM
jgi:signal transduction histidine kinase